MTYVPLSGLSLRDIEYVVAVDDLRNFSRAAERCGVSQGGLSEQVRKLEGLLGVILFERSRRHVAPTPDGARLIALGRDVLAAARTMIEAARVQTGPLEGVLPTGIGQQADLHEHAFQVHMVIRPVAAAIGQAGHVPAVAFDARGQGLGQHRYIGQGMQLVLQHLVRLQVRSAL